MFKKIGIAGAGGIGSNLLAIFFDYGFNRKQFDYVGQHKVSVLEEKYVVNGIKKRMTVKDFKNYDMIFSCVDSMPFRKALYDYGWVAGKNKLFWVDGRCTSRQGALFNSDLPKEQLQPYVDSSQEEGGCLLAYEKDQNISHTLPTIVAGMMVQAFLNKLRGQQTFKSVFMV
jgi:sRNA-binding regulator protein Hfq